VNGATPVTIPLPIFVGPLLGAAWCLTSAWPFCPVQSGCFSWNGFFLTIKEDQSLSQAVLEDDGPGVAVDSNDFEFITDCDHDSSFSLLMS